MNAEIRYLYQLKAYMAIQKVIYLLIILSYIKVLQRKEDSDNSSYTIAASEPDTGLTASAAGNVEGGESIFVQLTLSSKKTQKKRGQTLTLDKMTEGIEKENKKG